MKNLLLKLIYAILRCEAKTLLSFRKPEIIAITGTVGKTSTKDAIAHVLKDKYFVWESPGNLNAEIGVPLTILGHRSEKAFGKIELLFSPLYGVWRLLRHITGAYPEILIIEMGAEHKGDIKTFSKLAKPKIGVVTAVSPVHLVNFGNVEGVWEEKCDLVRSLPADGVAVLNKKDELVSKMAKETKAKIKYFSAEPQDLAKEAAKAVAEIYQIKNAESKLTSFKMPKGRMNIIKTKDFTILDDSYNSNPLAARAALEQLSKMEGERKIAILGDMLEQGDNTSDAHNEIGELAGKICDQVYFIGEYGDYFSEGAKKNLDLKYITKVSNSSEAASKVLSWVKPDDVILVKGSRGVALDKVVDKLKEGE